MQMNNPMIRFDMFLTVESAKNAIQFYVDELKLFRVRIEYGMECFLLSAVDNNVACLRIREGNVASKKSPLFVIGVKDCDEEFARVSKIKFSNGAGIVPDRNGLLQVSDFPTGKNFVMEDPSGNRFILSEDYLDVN
jgi:predicted enzyme related to lactoylglutathione lyase